jgi:16S rRNA (uracil1498-N3)-methyltransferase
MKIRTRVYYQPNIALLQNLVLLNNHYNHLIKVLRCNVGEFITIFNKESGEFVAKIVSITKNSVAVEITKQIKAFEEQTIKHHLFYSPLKKDSNDFVIEKTTELGIHSICNLITARCVNKPILHEKMESKVIQAVEQCGRLDVPVILPPLNLQTLLHDINVDKYHNYIFLWLNEKATGISITEMKSKLPAKDNLNIAFIVGPEGGFNEQEQQLLLSSTKIQAIHLNTNILKAETACITALISLLNL